jgi:hypothetical protein
MIYPNPSEEFGVFAVSTYLREDTCFDPRRSFITAIGKRKIACKRNKANHNGTGAIRSLNVELMRIVCEIETLPLTSWANCSHGLI